MCAKQCLRGQRLWWLVRHLCGPDLSRHHAHNARVQRRDVHARGDKLWHRSGLLPERVLHEATQAQLPQAAGV
jgi:hypothetical protein